MQDLSTHGDEMEYMIWVVLGGVLLAVVISALVKAPGQSLNSRFVALGELKGKTKDQIVAVVGPPNSVSVAGEGKTVCQWMATGYHIALLFDGDTCEGVTHEFRA